MNRTRSRISPFPRAFTLIEVLAVVSLLTLITMILSSNLAATNEASELRAAVAQWKDLDARARAYAQRHEPVELSIAGDGRTLLVTGRHSDALLLESGLPRRATAMLESDRREGSIVIDRRGRSHDYTVTIVSDGAIRRWSVLGLTGAVVEGEE